jgi:hypothetical protein
MVETRALSPHLGCEVIGVENRLTTRWSRSAWRR